MLKNRSRLEELHTLRCEADNLKLLLSSVSARHAHPDPSGCVRCVSLEQEVGTLRDLLHTTALGVGSDTASDTGADDGSYGCEGEAVCVREDEGAGGCEEDSGGGSAQLHGIAAPHAATTDNTPSTAQAHHSAPPTNPLHPATHPPPTSTQQLTNNQQGEMAVYMGVLNSSDIQLGKWFLYSAVFIRVRSGGSSRWPTLTTDLLKFVF